MSGDLRPVTSHTSPKHRRADAGTSWSAAGGSSGLCGDTHGIVADSKLKRRRLRKDHCPSTGSRATTEETEDGMRRELRRSTDPQPFVVRGLASGWPALVKWSTRGHLVDAVRNAEGHTPMVDVALSSSDCFRGDVGSHLFATWSFDKFVEKFFTLEGNTVSEKIYLCQCPIESNGNGPTAFEQLRKDIDIPPALQDTSLSSINLWMSPGSTRSNVHYDCNHNVLVVVAGSKRVSLAQPSKVSSLQVMPTTVCGGTSSNHSALNDIPPVALHSSTELRAGDALFIPEGWYHQVDSTPGTIAVNFWWGGMDASMRYSPDAQPYYLRRVVHHMTRAAIDDALLSYRQRRHFRQDSAEGIAIDAALSLSGHVDEDSSHGLSDDGDESDGHDEGKTVGRAALDPGFIQYVGTTFLSNEIDERARCSIIAALDLHALKAVIRWCLSDKNRKGILAQLLVAGSDAACELMSQNMEKGDEEGNQEDLNDNQTFYGELFGAVDACARNELTKEAVMVSADIRKFDPSFEADLTTCGFADLMMMKKRRLAEVTQRMVLSRALGGGIV